VLAHELNGLYFNDIPTFQQQRLIVTPIA
jgi:hypothetical protein